jgi:aspartyl-tRNA(Asn)/glutamyl-tRNA(Gln) amidotransferase subunit B
MTYETVIGLEIHVQLSTRSKAFCSDEIRFGAEPNTLVSPISLGHPGTLPRLNFHQVEYAIKLGLALGSEINLRHTFDRKNYFYADLPKGYQITQDALPICVGGSLEISVGEETKRIRIHHIHMEEDAGKSIHDSEDPYSYIDLNRAGTPLLEIVTEPDLRSAEEVDAMMTAMRQLVQYLDISDGNMQEGNMRCDVNVSIRPAGSTTLGNRCEIKNLNSMRYARKAIEYEVHRQRSIVEGGDTVQQETLNFDPETGVTFPLRSKEEAHDYRYFPDPDLPPVMLSADYLAQVQAEMPTLPWEVRRELREKYGLSEYDLNLLSQEWTTAEYYEALCEHTPAFKAAANLVINKLLPWMKERHAALSEFPVDLRHLAAFIDLIESNQVSHSVAYQQLFPALIAQPQADPAELAKSLNLLQSDDAAQLQAWIDAVIAANPDKVKAFQNGKKGLIGFFMGEVMKLSQGKAEPKQTNALLRKRLG